MTTLNKLRPLTVEEYLEGEKYAHTKHEFVGGEVYAMIGTSRAHNDIAKNLLMALGTHLRGTACKPYISDVKLRLGSDFYYPDILVTCNRADANPLFVTRPVLIIEVLSPGTAMWDTRHKLTAYKSIASLREYVLVDQKRREVRVHRRAGRSWRTDLYTGSQSIKLASVDLALPLDDVYRDVLR